MDSRYFILEQEKVLVLCSQIQASASVITYVNYICLQVLERWRMDNAKKGDKGVPTLIHTLKLVERNDIIAIFDGIVQEL